MKWFRRKDEPERAPQGGAREVLRPAPPKGWRSYDFTAEQYARTLATHTDQILQDMLTLAEPAGRILDAGTGTGASVEPRAQAFGIDRSQALLRLGPRARVAAADLLDLPFKDGTFDVVTANLVLSYVPKLETSMFDMIRVLAPGGRLAVSAWGAGEDDLSRTWRTQVQQTLGIEMYRQAVAEMTPWAEKLSDPRKLETVLRDAGLRPVRVEQRRYKLEMTREAYVEEMEAEPIGRFVRGMLSDRLWEAFRERARAAFAASFPEQIGDFRDVLIAVGTKP